MVQKYSRLLEERDINYKTNAIWTINDVPKTWRKKTEDKVISDGYHFLIDGTAEKNVEPEPEPNIEEENNEINEEEVLN